ncbi:MAG TPA: DUF4199 domain-containing protein, partial [Flavobacteriaceae bacterium]|nr:DUF4199 domain-containing protein [Flavobacteriaceae bacterium]
MIKQTVYKYGSFGLITAIALFLLALTFGSGMSYTAQEVLGYLTILVSLSFIYFGVKHYRDKVNHGVLSLPRALAIGMLIALLVGI